MIFATNKIFNFTSGYFSDVDFIYFVAIFSVSRRFSKVVLETNPSFADQNLLYRLSKEKNQALGFSIFIINKNIPGMLGTAYVDGKTYICPLEDFGLVVTASVYASLVKIFADCNPEKAQECKRRQQTIEKLIEDLIFWF